jgi:hypothetical protein
MEHHMEKEGEGTMLVRTLAATAFAAITASASAGIVGFVEDFPTGDANWRGATDAVPLEWSALGGPDGAAYVTSVFDLSGTSAGGFPATVIRASASQDASGGEYVGNWLAAGVTGVSFWFRHDLAEPIQSSLRVAPASNFPGGSAFSFTSIAAGEWTEVFFDLSAASPQWVSFSGTSYEAVMSSIANIQIGFLVPEDLAGTATVGRFDMTDFMIVPAPAAGIAILAWGLGLRTRRRAAG